MLEKFQNSTLSWTANRGGVTPIERWVQMCRVRFLGLSRAVNIWSKNWDPKPGQLLFSMDLVTHNQGKSISPVYEKVRSPGHRNNTRHHEKCQNAFYTILIRTSVLDYFVNNELHDKSRQWINVKLKNDPMAGEGKKREKFHTHRAGKLDQENLYTGAAHL